MTSCVWSADDYWVMCEQRVKSGVVPYRLVYDLNHLVLVVASCGPTVSVKRVYALNWELV